MPDSSAQSRVLTLVFTDLADSTALKTARGDQAVGDLILLHRGYVTQLAGECNGRIIDWAGDGCFLTFETSSAAVTFALRLEQTHADNPELPGVRIGVHMGEVTERPGPGEAPRIEGLAVDIAARISGLAKPGQVLMSASVHNSARQRLGVETFGQPILWQAHGTYELKGFDEPMDIREAGVEGIAPLQAPSASEKAKPLTGTQKVSGSHTSSNNTPMIAAVVAIVLLIGLVGYLLGTRTTSTPETSESSAPPIGSAPADAPITSLAVLPLDNLMNDPSQDFFADGMTEAITAELAKIKSLKVISRTSVTQYKGTTKTMPEIAAELGVLGLIEGSVLRAGDDVRITAQLIHGPSDTHLWSNSYDGTTENILQLHSDVAMAIVQEINATLTPEEEQQLAGEPYELDPEAYENFLLGEHFLDENTEESILEAIDYYEKAIEIDPAFADAWAKLSMAHGSRSGWSISSPREAFPEARAAARRALELDPQSALGHRAMSWVAHGYDWEWQEAERLYRRAIELNPNDSQNHLWYAWFMTQQGRTEEALRQAQTAMDLDPNSRSIRSNAAAVMANAGQWSEAIEQLEQVLIEEPDFVSGLDIMTWAQLQAGNIQEATMYAERWMENEGDQVFPRLRLAWIYGHAGREDEAREILDQLDAESDERYTTSSGRAWVYIALGEYDNAFEALDQGFENRDWFSTWMNLYPIWPGEADSALTDDPRYWQWRERMNFRPFEPGHPGYQAEQAWLQRKAAVEEANAPIEKIAVLPFENLMRDPEQEYFVDGMTEALISELNQVRSLQVRGRTSVNRFKGTTMPLDEIARELDVDGIIEGSVLREGDTVRITARLIHAASGTPRWSGSLDSTVTSVLKLHSEMALAITRDIEANLTPQEQALLASAEDVDSAAYDQYLMGQYNAALQSLEGFRQAAEHYRRAIDLDPNYADAHAGLAFALMGPSFWAWEDIRNVIEEVRAAIQTAQDLDPNSSRAESSLGFATLFYDREWVKAEQILRRAIELDINNMYAHWGLSFMYGAMGDHETEARAYADRAMQADPYSPDNLDALGDHFKLHGDLEEDIALRRRALTLDPDHVGHLWNLTEDYSNLGRHEEALATHTRVLELQGRPFDGWHAALRARSGDEALAREVLRQIKSPETKFFVDPFSLAMAHSALGEMKTALDYLEQAYETRNFYMTLLRSQWFAPYLDPFRNEPRFQAIIEKMNFPEAAN